MKPLGFITKDGLNWITPRSGEELGNAITTLSRNEVTNEHMDGRIVYEVPVYSQIALDQYRALFADYDPSAEQQTLPTFEECQARFNKMREDIVGLRVLTQAIKGSRWRHYKGDVYVLISEGKLESEGDANKSYAVYQSEADGKVWIRPMMEFLDFVNHNGQFVNRFTRLED